MVFVAALRKVVRYVRAASRQQLECSQWTLRHWSSLGLQMYPTQASRSVCVMLTVSLLCDKFAPELAVETQKVPQGLLSRTLEARSQFGGTEERDLP